MQRLLATKKPVLLLGLLAMVVVLMSSLWQVQAQESTAEGDTSCDWGYLKTVQERLLEERKVVEPLIDNLTDQPDLATSELVRVGVENLRNYSQRQDKICSEMLTKNQASPAFQCAQNTQEIFIHDFNSCREWVAQDLAYQKMVLERLMIYDAYKKKISFLVQKYRELNSKFRGLLEKVVFIQGQLNNMVAAIDKVTKAQRPAN